MFGSIEPLGAVSRSRHMQDSLPHLTQQSQYQGSVPAMSWELKGSGQISCSLLHPGFCHRSKPSHRPQGGRLPGPPAPTLPGDGLKDIADGPGDLPPVSSPYPGRVLVGRQREKLD